VKALSSPKVPNADSLIQLRYVDIGIGNINVRVTFYSHVLFIFVRIGGARDGGEARSSAKPILSLLHGQGALLPSPKEEYIFQGS
jgi:hypothetical protein